MANPPSTGGATPAVVKQGGYPEIEQSAVADSAQQKTEQALGRKMRGRNKADRAQPPQEPEARQPGGADHGR